MRFLAPAAALSLALATASSVAYSADRDPSPRAAMLIEEGRAALAAGDSQAAIDSFEAAFTVDPGYTPVLIDLAKAARADKLQGKAIAYYREAQKREPKNFAAWAGEGEALIEKGAIDKARANLTKLESLCGEKCPETRSLALAIASAASEGPALAARESSPSDANSREN